MNYATSSTGNRVKYILSGVCPLGLMGATGLVEGKILFLSLIDLTWGLIGMPHLGSRLAMSITGLGIFSFAISLLPTQSMFITKPVSILIYCGVLLLFRDFREQELVAVISLVRKGG